MLSRPWGSSLRLQVDASPKLLQTAIRRNNDFDLLAGRQPVTGVFTRRDIPCGRTRPPPAAPSRQASWSPRRVVVCDTPSGPAVSALRSPDGSAILHGVGNVHDGLRLRLQEADGLRVLAHRPLFLCPDHHALLAKLQVPMGNQPPAAYPGSRPDGGFWLLKRPDRSSCQLGAADTAKG